MQIRYGLILAAAFLVATVSAAALQDRIRASTRIRDTTYGKGFVVGFGENFSNRDQEGDPSLLITVNTLDQATRVRITNQTGFRLANYIQPPFTSQTLQVDYQQYRNRLNTNVQPIGIEVDTNEYVSVNVANVQRGQPAGLGSGATASAIIPTRNLGRHYVVATYNNSASREQEFTSTCIQVIAAKADTQVTFKLTQQVVLFPSRTIVSPGTPYTVALPKALDSINVCLERGDTDETFGDLTGSTVSSTKDVAVFGFNLCASVPFEFFGCDPIFEQMIPTDALGKETVIIPTFPRQGSQGDIVRVVPASDNTKIYVNGSLVATMNVGEYYEFLNFYASYTNVSASKPALFVQYSTGRDAPLFPRDLHVGDPFMAIVPAISSWLSDYSVNTFAYPDPDQNTAAPFTNYLGLATLTSAINSVTINGAPVVSEWRAISGGRYSVTVVAVNSGTAERYRVLNTAGAGMMVQVYGFGKAAGYGYNGGQSF